MGCQRGTPLTSGGGADRGISGPTTASSDSTKSGTLYVAATGKPYPVSVAKGSSGSITFDSWNAAVTLNAPPNAVDISALAG